LLGDLQGIEMPLALQPQLVERRYYARGVGLVLTETVGGGAERVELVSYEGG